MDFFLFSEDPGSCLWRKQRPMGWNFCSFQFTLMACISIYNALLWAPRPGQALSPSPHNCFSSNPLLMGLLLLSLCSFWPLSTQTHSSFYIFSNNQPTNQLGTESSDSLYLVVAFSRNNWQSLSPFLYHPLCPIAICLLPPIPLKLYLLRSPVTYWFGFYLHWPLDSLWHKSFLKLLPPWLLQHQLILFSSCFPDCSFPGSLWTPFPIWMYFIHMRQCLPHRGPVKKKLCMLSA